MTIPHTIKSNRVTMSKKDFDAMVERMEDLEDALALKTALAAKEELFPMDLAKRIHAGESPLRVYREHRGLTQDGLADKVGISKAMISRIESGKLKGSIDTLKALAAALDIDLDDIA